MKWRAYYADGRTLDSSEVAWEQLPASGLPGVVVFLEPPYRRVLDGYDWIYMEDGEFKTVETHDEWGQWADPPDGVGPALVKQGVGLSDEEFYAIQRRMLEDRAWP